MISNQNATSALKVALKQLGWTDEQVEELCQSNRLLHLQALVQFCPQMISPPSRVVLSDHSCRVRGYCLGQHLMYDDIDWNPELFQLVPAENRFGGWDFHNRLKKNHKPLNANLLDYLLAYPYLIPESWRLQDGRGRKVFFHGTSYQCNSVGTHIRGMSFREEDDTWHELMLPIMNTVGSFFTALVFA